jgi:hypothetical protein
MFRSQEFVEQPHQLNHLFQLEEKIRWSAAERNAAEAAGDASAVVSSAA